MRARERESVTRASEQERESKMDRVERRRGEGGREGGRKRQREREREGGGRKGWGGGGDTCAARSCDSREEIAFFSCLGFRVWGLGFRVWGLGFGV